MKILQRNTRLVCWPLLIVITAVLSGCALPKMTFRLVNSSSQPELTVTASELLVCADERCLASAPLEVGGPQGLFCFQGTCQASSYGRFAQHNKIRLTFSDGKTLTSNVFSNHLFETPYQAHLHDDRLTVSLEITAVRPAMLFHPVTNLSIVAGTLLLLTLYFVYSVARLFISRRNKMRVHHENLPNHSQLSDSA